MLRDGSIVNGKTLGIYYDLDAGLMQITDPGPWHAGAHGRFQQAARGPVVPGHRASGRISTRTDRGFAAGACTADRGRWNYNRLHAGRRRLGRSVVRHGGARDRNSQPHRQCAHRKRPRSRFDVPRQLESSGKERGLGFAAGQRAIHRRGGRKRRQRRAGSRTSIPAAPPKRRGSSRAMW